MIGWHLTLATDGRVPMFRGEVERRAALQVVARLAGGLCALFALVDEHLHLVLVCERALAGRLAQALNLALRALVTGPLEPARIRPIESRSHAEYLLRYCLGQPEHHRLPVHPALWTGSCFPDLCGARQLPGLQLQVMVLLPRFQLRQAHAEVGLPATRLLPCSDEELCQAGPHRLVASAASAQGIGPGLIGNSAPVVRARIAVCQLARAAGLPVQGLADALKVARQSTHRLAAHPADEAAQRCIRLWLSLEAAVSRAADPTSQLRNQPEAARNPDVRNRSETS